MIDPLSVADEQQLAEWAFGRQGVVTDRELAEAALRELARRAAVAKAEAEAAAAAAVAAELDANGAGSEPDAPPPSRITRKIVVLAAAIVLAAIVAVLLIMVAAQPTSSLAVFDREPTADELDLSIVVPQELFAAEVEVGVSAAEVEVRILAESPAATVVAFRTESPGSDASGTVCVTVVEFGVASDTTCTSVDDFASVGITTTLRGRTGLFAIDWGPTGEAEIRFPDDFDVGPSGG